MGKELIIFISSFILYIVLILMPIYFFIKKRKSNDVVKYLRLKENWIKGILIGSLISFVYVSLFIFKGMINNSLNVNLNIGTRWLYGLTVGLLEEIPFRGFLLKIFEEKYPFIKANILVTVIFLVLHFPSWIIGGTDIIRNIFSVSIVSLIFGYLVKEYDSLWITVICHSVFNICIWIRLS